VVVVVVGGNDLSIRVELELWGGRITGRSHFGVWSCLTRAGNWSVGVRVISPVVVASDGDCRCVVEVGVVSAIDATLRGRSLIWGWPLSGDGVGAYSVPPTHFHLHFGGSF